MVLVSEKQKESEEVFKDANLSAMVELQTNIKILSQDFFWALVLDFEEKNAERMKICAWIHSVLKEKKKRYPFQPAFRVKADHVGCRKRACQLEFLFDSLSLSLFHLF